MTLQTQFVTMLVMVASGLYVGFATTTYRRLIFIWRHKLVVRYGFEIFYWIMQVSLLFYILYRMNAGEVRLLFGLACLLGYSMYVVLCSFWYEKVLEQIIRIVKSIVRWTSQAVYQLVIRPIYSLGRLLFLILLSICRFIIKILYIIVSPFIKLLKKYLPKRILNIISKLPTFCSTIVNKLKSYRKKIWKKWR